MTPTPSARSAQPTVARTLAAVMVAGVAAVVLVAGAHSSIRTTASIDARANQVGFAGAYAQTECLRTEVRGLVPRGAGVYLGPGTTEASQILSRSVTLWAVPTPDPQNASWTLSLQNVPGGCAGTRVVATRNR
jgi:hypothetical protein